MKFLVVLTLLLSTFNQAVSKDNILLPQKSNYSICKIKNKQNQLLKCIQIENSPYYHMNLFDQNCEKLQKKGVFASLIRNKSCPQSSKYLCQSPGHLIQVKPSEFYYYDLKNEEKIKTRCIHDYRDWYSYKDSELNFSSFKSVTCKKIKNHRLISCDRMASKNINELKKFYNSCQINHQEDIYYQTEINTKCPDATLYNCLIGEAGEWKELNFYKNYKNLSKEGLVKHCNYLKKQNYSFDKSNIPEGTKQKAVCKVFSKNKLRYCSSIFGDKEVLSKHLINCMTSGQSTNAQSDFRLNDICPQDEVDYSCLDSSEKKQNFYLYQVKKSLVQRFYKQCLSLKKNWVKK